MAGRHSTHAHKSRGGGPHIRTLGGVTDRYIRKAIAKPGGVRGIAELMLRGGIMSVQAAFNVGGNPSMPWTFPVDVQARAEELCQELLVLFRNGEITPRTSGLVQRDADFQQFMGRLTQGRSAKTG